MNPSEVYLAIGYILDCHCWQISIHLKLFRCYFYKWTVSVRNRKSVFLISIVSWFTHKIVWLANKLTRENYRIYQNWWIIWICEICQMHCDRNLVVVIFGLTGISCRRKGDTPHTSIYWYTYIKAMICKRSFSWNKKHMYGKFSSFRAINKNVIPHLHCVRS